MFIDSKKFLLKNFFNYQRKPIYLDMRKAFLQFFVSLKL